MSERIQIALNALADTIGDVLTEAEAKRLEALGAAQQAAADANGLRSTIERQQVTLGDLAKELAAYKAGGSGLPTLPTGGRVPPGRYLAPQAPTGTSWIIDQGTVEVVGTGSPLWPQGGALFDVRAGASLLLKDVACDTVTPPPLSDKGKYRLPPCVALLGKLTALHCRVGAVDTFVEALPPAADVLLDDCDADGFTSYVLYSGGAKRCTVRNSRIGNSGVETPLRATSHKWQNDPVTYVSEDFAVLWSTVKANPRKQAMDLRRVNGATVVGCTIEQQRNAAGKLMTVVRLGDDSEPGCNGLVFARNTIRTGQIFGKGKVTGIVYGNDLYGCDPLEDNAAPLNLNPGVRPLDNVAWVSGPLPANPQPASTVGGCEWRQAPAVTVPGNAGPA